MHVLDILTRIWGPYYDFTPVVLSTPLSSDVAWYVMITGNDHTSHASWLHGTYTHFKGAIQSTKCSYRLK